MIPIAASLIDHYILCKECDDMTPRQHNVEHFHCYVTSRCQEEHLVVSIGYANDLNLTKYSKKYAASNSDSASKDNNR